jgi:hypothetical protein
MVRVNNLAETNSSDNTAVKGLENKSQQSEKFGNIAVDSWSQIGQNSKDAAGKSNLGNSKDGLTKDGTALTFSDPFKKNLMENPSEAAGKKLTGEEAIAAMVREKKELAGDDAIRNKKEKALEEANAIQKKKELADSGKPGATVEGSLDFSPAKPKVPADGGLKDKEVQGSEIIKNQARVALRTLNLLERYLWMVA